MKAIATLALIAAVSLTLSSTASAGWRNTRWGMTENQIKAAYPTAVLEGQTFRLRQHDFAGVTWDTVSLVMAAGKLEQVVLATSQSFGSVTGRLTSQLGQPSMNRSQIIREAVYRDTANRNTITVMGGPGPTIVTYKGVTEGF